jgi:hypothetical protein
MRDFVIHFNRKFDDTRDRFEDLSDWLYAKGITWAGVLWGIGAVGALYLGRTYHPGFWGVAAVAAWISGLFSGLVHTAPMDEGYECSPGNSPQCDCDDLCVHD